MVFFPALGSFICEKQSYHATVNHPGLLVTVVPTGLEFYELVSFFLQCVFSVPYGESVVQLRCDYIVLEHRKGPEEILDLAKVPLAPDIDVCFRELHWKKSIAVVWINNDVWAWKVIVLLQ